MAITKNPLTWEKFKTSALYKRLVGIFDPNRKPPVDEEILQLEKELGNTVDPELFVECFYTLYENFYRDDFHLKYKDEVTRMDFKELVDKFEVERVEVVDDQVKFCGRDNIIVRKDDYEMKAGIFDCMSTILYFVNPFFKPMLHGNNFSLIESCMRVGIPVPAVPKAGEYRKALMWYYDLCVSFRKYQDEHGMSDADLCARLYYNHENEM